MSPVGQHSEIRAFRSIVFVLVSSDSPSDANGEKNNLRLQQ